MKIDRGGLWFLCLVLAMFATRAIAETVYVSGRYGGDANPGTKEKPVKTIRQAAVIINGKTETPFLLSQESRGSTIKIAPGIYNLTECVVFENKRPYTAKDRLVIEADILPDEPNWNPALMPVILSAEDPRRPEKINERTETYGMKVKISHVSVYGLKFLGNPLPNNWHCCIERVGDNLADLVVRQCMFVGEPNTLAIYCPVIGTGDGLVVEHCVFHKTYACAVFWDGPKGVGQKGCAMRYCIVDKALIAGVWTCQTADDFDCRHNIVTDSQYFWIRKPGDTIKYHIRDCVITNNLYYSGYGVETGPVAQTGPEVEYQETNIIKTGPVTLDRDKNSRNFLHVVPDTFGHDIGAGLFRKEKNP